MLEAMIISTLAGSIICIALMIFKNKILSLLGGKALYYISLVAMLVFILPMNIGDISLPKLPVNQTINVTEFESTVPETNTDTAPIQDELQEAPEAVQPYVMPKASNIVRRSNPVTVQEILIAIWLLGFIVSMCRYFVSYFRFKKKICGFDIHENINEVEVIKSPLISSPMIFGFFKPTLAIPETEMDESDYELAIRHEMVHYKHHDSWFKLFAVLVNSVYWFNPVTYLMVNLVGEACEYACDEQVTKEMNLSDKKKYSEMILSMVCQSSPSLSSNMVKSKKQLKRRFEMIMKKKRFSVFKTAICTVLMLALTCGSVVLANEAAPLVSSLLKDDYVYITNFGKNDYNEFVPVEKDGVYYLPLREFLNCSDIEDDKIKYDNGTITIDVWSTEVKFGGRIYMGDDGEQVHENPELDYPAKHIWSTQCTIDSKIVSIGENEVQLAHAPYLENGTTYVPYEYINLLKSYEDRMVKENFNDYTHKFVSVMQYGFDSFESKYYCDNVEIDRLPRLKKPVDEDTLMVVWSYSCTDADISIKKTGYRTEFHAKLDFVDPNNAADTGNAEIVLNEVTRIYSKGSDIEGLFTVKIDGQTVYENEKGYITSLPIPAGEGMIDHGETIVEIGETKLRIFFFGFGLDSHDEYSALSRKNRELAQKADTKKLSLFPSEVKLNGRVVERTDKTNSFHYNTDEEYAEIYLYFDNYTGEQGTMFDSYEITRNENSAIKVIDENTFSGHFFLEKSQTRIDSFDAIITLLPDNKFELKSNDGKYIVRGTTGAYIPLWEMTEEQKNAPLPQVVMIDE